MCVSGGASLCRVITCCARGDDTIRNTYIISHHTTSHHVTLHYVTRLRYIMYHAPRAMHYALRSRYSVLYCHALIMYAMYLHLDLQKRDTMTIDYDSDRELSTWTALGSRSAKPNTSSASGTRTTWVRDVCFCPASRQRPLLGTRAHLS